MLNVTCQINATQLRFPVLLGSSIAAWNSETFKLSALSPENPENKTDELEPQTRKRSKLEALSNYLNATKRIINAKHGKQDTRERRFLVKRRSTSRRRKAEVHNSDDRSGGKASAESSGSSNSSTM